MQQENTNSRYNYTQYEFEAQHLKPNDFKDRVSESKYLFEDMGDYPRPEFHVSHLKHDTERGGLRGIRDDEGFKNPGTGSLLWWSLAVRPEDIQEAETSLLETTYPDRTEEEVAMQQSFLWKFATSPAFIETSRLGSYRFTLPLDDVLNAYKEQFCSGTQLVMRVFKTVLYKQEVMYVVVVHSSANNEQFSKYPLLTDDPDAVCVYRDGRFLWRSQAMCETHRLELLRRPEVKQLDVQRFRSRRKFYVWDHVAVALHQEDSQVLKFDPNLLRENLTFCQQGPSADSEYVRYRFDDFSTAKDLVKRLWVDCRLPLKEERSLQQSFTVRDIRLVLIGRTGAGTSSTGNTILRRQAFSTAAGTTQCRQETGNVFGWEVTIVDTPGLSEASGAAVRTEIMNMSAPGPHAILLVIKMTLRAELEDVMSEVEQVFGEDVWSYTIIVFVQDDQTGPDIQQLKDEPEVQRTMYRTCRHLVLDNQLNPDDDDGQQVCDLLQEVEMLVVANEGRVYSI